MTSAGIWSTSFGSSDSETVAPSPSVWTAVTRADDQAAHLDVGLRVELGADPVDLERHRDAGAEGARVLRDGEPAQQQQHAEEGQPLQAPWRRHPATRTDVSVP